MVLRPVAEAEGSRVWRYKGRFDRQNFADLKKYEGQGKVSGPAMACPGSGDGWVWQGFRGPTIRLASGADRDFLISGAI